MVYARFKSTSGNPVFTPERSSAVKSPLSRLTCRPCLKHKASLVHPRWQHRVPHETPTQYTWTHQAIPAHQLQAASSSDGHLQLQDLDNRSFFHNLLNAAGASAYFPVSTYTDALLANPQYSKWIEKSSDATERSRDAPNDPISDISQRQIGGHVRKYRCKGSTTLRFHFHRMLRKCRLGGHKERMSACTSQP